MIMPNMSEDIQKEMLSFVKKQIKDIAKKEVDERSNLEMVEESFQNSLYADNNFSYCLDIEGTKLSTTDTNLAILVTSYLNKKEAFKKLQCWND